MENMHLNKKTGALLVRRSFRDKHRVCKITQASLTKWSAEEVEELEENLHMKRAWHGSALEAEADERIFSVLFSNGCHMWKISAQPGTVLFEV